MRIVKKVKVYVVTRPGIDTSKDMVQIAGIFATKKAAENMRVQLREKGLKQDLKIECFFLLDTL